MKIITIYTCDQWWSDASMSPYWIGTDINKFFDAVRKGIEDKTFDYEDSELVREDMIAQFDEDRSHGNVRLFSNLTRDMKLIYGYVTLNENNSYC